MSSYNIQSFVSPCHHAFNDYLDNIIVCTSCKNNVKTLENNETLTTRITYNVDNTSEGSNISGDLLKDQLKKAARCSDDITFELCSRRCSKCKSLTRIARDLNGVKYFICSNTKCRNVEY